MPMSAPALLVEPVLPMREPVRRPGRPRSRAADRAILDAALALVGEIGYRAVTIEAVAARAGVGRPTLYRRYADRTALFIAVYDRFAADERFAAPTGDPEADLAGLLSRLFELFSRSGLVAVLGGLVVDAQASPEQRDRLFSRLVGPRRRLVGAIVESARRAGRVRDDISADAVADHVAAIVWFRILAGGRTLDATFARETAALVVRGIAPMTGTPSPAPAHTPAPPVVLAGWTPGAIGRIASLHARYYAASHGFSLAFEARVATELSAFLTEFVPGRDHFATVHVDGELEGAIAVDGSADPARLRWFILSERLRGRGLGRRLLADAIAAAGAAGHRSLSLSTLAGLDAADRLYRDAGFRLTDEQSGTHWGVTAVERTMLLDLTAPRPANAAPPSAFPVGPGGSRD